MYSESSSKKLRYRHKARALSTHAHAKTQIFNIHILLCWHSIVMTWKCTQCTLFAPPVTRALPMSVRMQPNKPFKTAHLWLINFSIQNIPFVFEYIMTFNCAKRNVEMCFPWATQCQEAAYCAWKIIFVRNGAFFNHILANNCQFPTRCCTPSPLHPTHTSSFLSSFALLNWQRSQ